MKYQRNELDKNVLRPGHFYYNLLSLSKNHELGCLACSISKAWESWSWGHKFKPHIGGSALKKIKI